MIVLKKPFLGLSHPCPYLAGRQARYESFFAVDVSDTELEELLETGWRKFGIYFFRPACPGCRSCVPLRVSVGDFTPSKSQRRVLRKAAAAGVAMRLSPLRYTDRIFQIYTDHSRIRFTQETDKNDFMESFYTPSCPSVQSEYYIDDQLVGVGFLDCGSSSLSSVYFVYDTYYSHLRLGTLSALNEIAFARETGLKYYYLGYRIGESPRMAYKGQFRPHEHFDWTDQKWMRSDSLTIT
jgi:arginine-tRNA-protein transferase